MSTHILVSASDKTGIPNLLKALASFFDFITIATDGTFDVLKEHKISAITVEKFVGISESKYLKTIHPKISHAILPSDPKISVSIPIIIVNLYPLKSGVFDPETIDLGGNLLLRLAAKSALIYGNAIPVYDREDFPELIKQVKKAKNRMNRHSEISYFQNQSSKFSPIDAASTSMDRSDVGENVWYKDPGNIVSFMDQKFIIYLAEKVFNLTSTTDRMIQESIKLHRTSDHSKTLPDHISYSLEKTHSLKYGENPHYEAAFYQKNNQKELFSIIRGNVSSTNLLDAEAGLRIVSQFSEMSCVVIKHTNPCGFAIGNSQEEACIKAFEADFKSAFGGVVVFNSQVDFEVATILNKKFISVIAAPGFSTEGLQHLRQKERVIILQLNTQPVETMNMKQVLGGFICETTASIDFNFETFQVMTQAIPTKRQRDALLIAAKVNSEVKSNSIVIVKNEVAIGIGSGQQSRIDAVEIALSKAGKEAQRSVVSSDGFFPFPDSIELFTKAGIEAIIQPGGSKNDQQVIDACDKYGIAMIHSHRRLFKH